MSAKEAKTYKIAIDNSLILALSLVCSSALIPIIIPATKTINSENICIYLAGSANLYTANPSMTPTGLL